MNKVFVGLRLKKLREQRGLTQLALAQALGLSPSYLNQMENNQRPLTAPVLMKVHATFGVDMQFFSEDEATRLLPELREALAESAVAESITLVEIQELARQMPSVGRVLVRLNQRCRMAEERVALLASRLGEGRGLPVTALPLQPYEEVRDFFYAHHNHIPQLDALAESLSRNWGMRTDDIAARLEQRLIETHGVRIVRIPDMGAQTDEVLRTFDPEARVLRLSVHLKAGQRAFQLATQLAYLEAGDLITQVADGGSFASEEARALSRIGLASYFAGALILPYGAFLAAAEALRYDIELLGRRFGVSFETVCHRLSTLQRPEAPGVPFFFIRVDRAGNISKRQSATDFHFSRAGGTCPLWSVYEAFAHPGRILAQLASMPDGRINLWIARSVSHPRSAYGAPASQFAIALGCDLRHAGRLVYSKGLDLKDPGAATPIGAGCKVCDRHGCAQRAFPALGRSLSIDEHVRRLAP